MNKSLFRMIVLMILLGQITVGSLGQKDQIQQNIGVSEGQTYKYQITNILNFQNVPLFTGINGEQITGDLGDVFTLEIIDTELTDNAEIELQIQKNDNEKVTYLNKMDTFDLIVFTDWEYWQELVTSYNILYEESEEFFEFQVAFANDGFVYYLVTRYDKQTGVFIYQLIYVVLEGFLDTPVAYVEIMEGDPLPQPDKSMINVSFTDFYRYKLTQLVGYESKPVINGTNGQLYAQEGDTMEVLIVNKDLTQNRELLVAAKIGNNTVSLYNRMDFLNTVYDITFFVFNDWNYMAKLADEFKKDASEFHDIEYEITYSAFIYKEEFWNQSDVYFNLEVQYDLATGVLLYEALYFENYTSSEISLLEMHQMPSIQVDKSSLQNIDESEFLFIIEEFNATEHRPVFTTSDGNIWLFEGDIFELVFSSINNEQNQARLTLVSFTQAVEFNNSLTSLGAFALYPDWIYWNKYIDFIEDFTDNTTEIISEENDQEFSFTLRIRDNATNYNYTTVYEKMTGVINEITVNYVITSDNETLALDLKIARYQGEKPDFIITQNGNQFTLDTITTTGSDTQDDATGFTLVNLLLIMVVIVKIRKSRGLRS